MLAPASVYTGLLSPVILDVSIFDSPDNTLQSTGTFSPGLTKILSPTFKTLTSTTSVLSPVTRFAFLAFIDTISSILLFDLSTALSSILLYNCLLVKQMKKQILK